MAPKERSGKGGSKGFGSMDEEKKKRIASQGGHASARAKNTSNRGFASMDKDKQREISSLGGKASKSTQSPGGKDDRDADQSGSAGEKDATIRVPDSLKERDETASSGKTQDSLAYSETDEDEDEGLGDGNLGRSTRGGVLGK